MKATCTFLILYFLATALFSQGRVGLESPEIDSMIDNRVYIPKVSGKLLNYSHELDGALMLKYVIASPSNKGSETKLAIVDGTGRFELEIEKGLPYQQIWFYIGDYCRGEFFANKSLEITLDLDVIRKKKVWHYGKGITINGSDAGANIYLNRYHRFKTSAKKRVNKRRYNLFVRKENWTMDLDVKLERVREIHDKLNNLEDAYLRKYPSKYSWILENEHNSKLYSDLFLSHFDFKMSPELLRECLAHVPLLVSNNSGAYYRYLGGMLSLPTIEERVGMAEEVFLSHTDEKIDYEDMGHFFTSYRNRLSGEDYDKQDYDQGETKYLLKYGKAMFEEKLKHQLKMFGTISESKSSIVKLFSEPSDIWERQRYLEESLPTTKFIWCKELMKESLAKDKRKIAEISRMLKDEQEIEEMGETGERYSSLDFGAKLYVSEHLRAEDLIRSIRSRHKGKAIILDVWATWCGPCISDMIKSREIKIEIAKLPVDIVYLCVESGSTEDKWKKKVAELKIPGDHMFLSKNLTYEVMNYFGLKGFPSYIFIDKDGNYDPSFIKRISMINLEVLKKKF